MRKLVVPLCCICLLFVVSTVSVAGGKGKKKGPFAPIKVDPKLPNVLIIGDSISIGYTLPTRANLKGKANVHRIPINGGPTIRGLTEIEKWLGERQWDVIHFNWGLHDLKMDKTGKHQVPIKEYEANLEKLVKRLKKQTKVLIWASTTPVPEGKVNPPRKDSDVQAYNKVAKQIMAKHDVVINDLYAFALPKLKEIQRSVNVHFTPEGSNVLGERVADVILRELKKK